MKMKLFALFFVFLLIVSFSFVVANDSGLVSHWKFDNDGEDSKDGNDIINFNEAEFSSGKLGNALEVFEDSQYAKLTPVPDNLKIEGDLSLEAWVKLDADAIPDFSYAYVIGERTGSSPNYALKIEETTGKVGFYYNGSQIVESSASLNTGEWYYLVGVKNGNSFKIYINGLEDASATSDLGVSYGGSDILYVGKLGNGLTDEVKIYNTALDAGEIKSEYESVIEGLVDYYPVSAVNYRGETCNEDSIISNDGQSAGLAYSSGSSYTLYDGVTATGCVKAEFNNVINAKNIEIEYQSVNSVCGDSCSGSYCGEQGKVRLFSSIDGDFWSYAGTLTRSSSVVVKKIALDKITPLKYVLVCRGAGGHGKDNVKVDYVKVSGSGSCYETDGGRYYNSKGVTYFDGNSNSDSCIGNVLTEYYCDGVSGKSETYSCSVGCDNGRCVGGSSSESLGSTSKSVKDSICGGNGVSKYFPTRDSPGGTTRVQFNCTRSGSNIGGSLCRIYSDRGKMFSFGSDGRNSYSGNFSGPVGNLKVYADLQCSGHSPVTCKCDLEFFNDVSFVCESVCNEGDFICDGNDLMECGKWGGLDCFTWRVKTYCGFGCDEGACVDNQNAYWTNMKNEKLSVASGDNSADKNDLVKLVFNKEGFSGEAVYTIYKKNIVGSDEVKVLHGGDFVTWRAGKKADGNFVDGDFYFEVLYNEETFTSDDLVVSATENNAKPTISSLVPEYDSKFIKGDVVNFGAIVEDVDDELRVVWNFGDGSGEVVQSSLDGSDFGTSHSYSKHGVMNAFIVAEEVGRSQDVSEAIRLFVYQEGKNYMAVITKPAFGEVFTGAADFDGSDSFIANCATDECVLPDSVDGVSAVCNDEIVGDSGSLFCYDYPKEWVGKTGGYELGLDWIFSNSGTTHLVGDWTNDYNDVVDFSRFFLPGANHYANLKVGYEQL